MNKKKYIIILAIVFILGGITNDLFASKNKESIVIYRRDNKSTFKNALSMMLEVDLGAGEYERSTSNKWPTEGYIFNKQLSKCENGGELDWDPVNNQVLMIGASSDKCYVYFDKYTSVIINNLSLTSTPTSITATVTATAGSASISKYLFSINNGAYIESDSHIHTFVGLNSSEEYSISVKAIDSNGRESLVTTELIETSAYVLPSITTVTSNVAWNQIKVTVSASNGTNNVSKYYYSINGGTYQESTNNTYTFNNLNESTAYTIKIKVVDTEGKYSSERIDIISTAAYVAPTITSLSTNVTASTIKITPTVTQGTGTISKYYYSKDDGASYTESTSNNYTFTGLSGGTTYSIKVYVKDSNGKTSNIYTKSVATTNPTLAAYIKGLYTSQGANGLYLHNSSLANSANDGSYRYAGASVNNYVCFGSTATTCPTDNLYRIIGVFGNQVKLIKYDFANSDLLGANGAHNYTDTSFSNSSYIGSLTKMSRYYWNAYQKSNFYWRDSLLNTTNLNGNYITYLGITWTNKIADTTWIVGGIANTNYDIKTVPAYKAYQNEIVSPAASTTYSAKIGLMYASDFGYAALPTYWTYYLGWNNGEGYYVQRMQNWMYMGLSEWTITSRTDMSTSAYYISAGYVADADVSKQPFYVRPCFYLNANVNRTGGTGTSTDPYRIE